MAKSRNYKNRIVIFSMSDIDKVMITPIIKVLNDIIKNIDKTDIHRILDVGCGSGHLTEKIFMKNFQGEFYGIEMGDGADEARRKGLIIHKADLNEIDKLMFEDNFFDLIQRVKRRTHDQTPMSPSSAASLKIDDEKDIVEESTVSPLPVDDIQDPDNDPITCHDLIHLTAERLAAPGSDFQYSTLSRNLQSFQTALLQRDIGRIHDVLDIIDRENGGILKLDVFLPQLVIEYLNSTNN